MLDGLPPGMRACINNGLCVVESVEGMHVKHWLLMRSGGMSAWMGVRANGLVRFRRLLGW